MLKCVLMEFNWKSFLYRKMNFWKSFFEFHLFQIQQKTTLKKWIFCSFFGQFWNQILLQMMLDEINHKKRFTLSMQLVSEI